MITDTERDERESLSFLEIQNGKVLCVSIISEVEQMRKEEREKIGVYGQNMQRYC